MADFFKPRNMAIWTAMTVWLFSVHQGIEQLDTLDYLWRIIVAILAGAWWFNRIADGISWKE